MTASGLKKTTKAPSDSSVKKSIKKSSQKSRLVQEIKVEKSVELEFEEIEFMPVNKPMPLGNFAIQLISICYG